MDFEKLVNEDEKNNEENPIHKLKQELDQELEKMSNKDDVSSTEENSDNNKNNENNDNLVKIGKRFYERQWPDGSPVIHLDILSGKGPFIIDRDGRKKYLPFNKYRNLMDQLHNKLDSENRSGIDSWNFFSEGSCLIKNGVIYSSNYFEGEDTLDSKKGRAFYVNENLDDTIGRAFKNGNDFSNGLALVQELDDDKWHYIDKNGNEAMNCDNFKEMKSFSDGLALVQQKDNDKYIFIGTDGKKKIETEFDLARPFNEGLAAVQKDGKWGFIDKDGNQTIDCQFDWVGSFYSNGLAEVQKGNEEYIIDKTGEIVRKIERSSGHGRGDYYRQRIAEQRQRQADLYHWGTYALRF